MHVFLETERLLLRRFTEGDVEELVELDGDPEVMHYITGGRPTSREEIETEVLPAFLRYYEQYVGYGFWAAVEKSTGMSSAGSTFGQTTRSVRTRWNSGTGFGGRRGVRGMPRRARGR